MESDLSGTPLHCVRVPCICEVKELAIMSILSKTELGSPQKKAEDKIPAEDYAKEIRLVRAALNSVSVFDGGCMSVEGFLQEVMHTFRSVRLDEEIFTRLLIVSRITGHAKEVFEIGEPVLRLNEFAETLRQRFTKNRSFEMLINQRARMVQRSESVHEYTMRFKRLQRDIVTAILNNSNFSNPGKKDLINNEEMLNCLQYVRGLTPKVRDRVQIRRPRTIDEAYKWASEAIEDFTMNEAVDATRETKAHSGIQPSLFQLNKSTHSHQRTKPWQRWTNRSRSFWYESAHPSSRNSQLHLPRYVSRKDALAPTSGVGRWCSTCGGPHHLAQCPVNSSVHQFTEDIPDKKPQKSRGPTLEEVFWVHQGDAEMIVELDFPSGPKTFVIDTGSRINLIKESAITGCNTEYSPVRFYGISGTEVTCEHKVTYSDHEFHVLKGDDLKTDGLLGRSFLSKERITLSFTEDIAENVRVISESCKDSRQEKLRQNLRVDHIESITRESILNLVDKYSDIFVLPGEYLPETQLTAHKIETTDEIPIQTKQYRLPPGDKDIILSQVDEMLKNKIIAHSKSPYNHPVRVVPKKMDASGKKKHRIVVDLRKLNEKTPQDNYPIPNITDIFDQLGRARYFSAFDLASGFHQIGLDKESRHKTAFSTPRGHFEFLRLPFGLRNAPAAFQRMMDFVLRDLIGKGIFVYLDDIIVVGESIEQHNANLAKLFKRLREVGLKLQPDKCEMLAPKLAYLGHLITPQGIQPNPIKLEAVRNFPVPKNRKELKQFLGLAGYYRKFVRNFSKIATPLTRLLRKDQDFVFSEDCTSAFNRLRDALCSNDVVLRVPDFSKPFILTTDASGYAIGSVLEQLDDKNQRRPVAYASRTLNDAERNYSTIEKELLAIVWSVKHFRPYLYGRKFKIRTDHQPLTWLMNLKDPSSRLMRWRIKLEEYEYEIEYVKGTSNAVADALSRNPVLIIHRWKKHITEVQEASENAIPVYFSRKADTKFKELRSPDDNSLLGMRISLEEVTPVTLKTMLEEVVQLLISEDKNLVYIEYEKLKQSSQLSEDEIAAVVKDVFLDPLIQVELGTRPMLTAHAEDEKLQIIQDYHDSLQAGHQGVTKTLKMMLKRYYWRGIQKDVHDYIVKCAVCQTTKHDRVDRKAKRKIVTMPEKRNEKIALDIVGPLTETAEGHSYILTLQDCLTKLVQAYPLKEQTSAAILDQLVNNYFPSYGIPKCILTDQGKNFVSELNRDFCELFKIKHITCSPFHPESNGSLERMHGNMKDFLKANTNNIKEWDTILPFFILYYNNTEHTSTGYSPFELTFGQEPFQLVDLDDTHGKTYNDYLAEIIHKLDTVWNKAKQKDLKIKIRLTNKFNQGRKAHTYVVGQNVLLKAEESRKLGRGIRNPFVGPYKITKIISDQNIEIDKGSNALEVVHINRVRPFNT